MSATLHIEDLRQAWDARDPAFVDLVLRLVSQPDEPPATPLRQGAPTYDAWLQGQRTYSFKKMSKEARADWRREKMQALEAPGAEVPLPDRLRVHEVLLQLWADDTLFARTCLKKLIARVPLVHGPWRALKRIFKEAEAKNDTEIYGALAARFDSALSQSQRGGVSGATLAYLCRRAWRYLRRVGQTLPACYADVACDYLAAYTNDTQWLRTWIANHVFYHESKLYGRTSFRLWQAPKGGLLKQRAFAELWQRTPRPLFSLLERAQSEQVWLFATEALKADFRAQLREVEPAWVARLVHVPSAAVHSFLVWILTNVPRFEQSAFRKLGLHDAVLQLFDSPAADARAYAAEYARVHARDLPLDELVRLANNDNESVKKLVLDLLLARDARRDIGLDAWGRLLDTKHGHALAALNLKKHFGASELTPAWFKDRFFAPSQQAFHFAKEYLPQVHPPAKLGPAFFMDLIEACDLNAEWQADRDQLGTRAMMVALYGLTELARFDLNALDVDFLRRALLRPSTQKRMIEWVDEGKLKQATFGVEFLKNVAYEPGWQSDPWITALGQSDRPWARTAQGHRPWSAVLGWLADVRIFSPAEIGMDWLLQLVPRSEPLYHDFAVERLIKSFAPADFAPVATAPVTTALSTDRPIDLAKATFVFTGKLATMNRKEAEDKVKTANGVASSSVSPKLHYLVIGDEGSPLYGAGNKGSKQLKAEELNEAGANIKIISETAFLQMLAGKKQEHSADATLAGCQRLWDMVVAPGPADAPLGQFARRYVRRHHPDISMAETDRPVDAGTEIPQAFLTFDRVQPLFAETRKPLREFALELAKWEFARWQPPAQELVKLCELPHADVRKFVADALLADDAPQNRRMRIAPDSLTPAAVYRFCESLNEATRSLGLQIIERVPKLRQPEELFRLTESPDRKVRAFVIRALWALYRDRGVTADWKPHAPPQATVGGAARKQAAKAVENLGDGVPPRPEQPPAASEAMQGFLRRVLFEIPPGRMAPAAEEDKGILAKLKPLPTRKAKLSLVEIMRDLALEDADFARGVLPVLREFMTSFGLSERDACLVAVTRIVHKHNMAV
jgi:hypothetical protein